MHARDFVSFRLASLIYQHMREVKSIIEEGPMRLSLLLLLLYLKLKGAAKKNKAFQSYIGIVQLRILIRTADGKRGRLFIFDKGKVSSLGGTDHRCDAALIWADPKTAFKVMIKGSDEATFLAAASGKLRVEGMAYFIQWFNDGVKIVMQRA
jgi:putative sterol carrier protein